MFLSLSLPPRTPHSLPLRLPSTACLYSASSAVLVPCCSYYSNVAFPVVALAPSHPTQGTPLRSHSSPTAEACDSPAATAENFIIVESSLVCVWLLLYCTDKIRVQFSTTAAEQHYAFQVPQQQQHAFHFTSSTLHGNSSSCHLRSSSCHHDSSILSLDSRTLRFNRNIRHFEKAAATVHTFFTTSSISVLDCSSS